MPYELRYGNPFTTGMGGALYDAERRRESFAQSVERARLALQSRSLDIQETDQQLKMTLAELNNKREVAKEQATADQWRQGKVFARDETAATLQAKGFRPVQADADGNLPTPDRTKGETLVTLKAPGEPDQLLIGVSDEWQQQQTKLQARDQIQEKRAADLIAAGAEELTAPEDVAAAKKEGRLTAVGYSDGHQRTFRVATRAEAVAARADERRQVRTETDEQRFQLAGGRPAAAGETAPPTGHNAVKDAAGRTWFVPSETWQKTRQQQEEDWRRDAISLERDTTKQLTELKKASGGDPDAALTRAAKNLAASKNSKQRAALQQRLDDAKAAREEQAVLKTRIERAKAARRWVADNAGKAAPPPEWVYQDGDDAWLATPLDATAKYGRTVAALQKQLAAQPAALKQVDALAAAIGGANAYERNVAAWTLDQLLGRLGMLK